MASEERRTKSTEELVKEIKSGVWGYGAERRDNITKQYGAAAYKAAQTIVNEHIIKEEHKRRKLLSQCIYKVMGYDSDRTQYKPPHTRQKIGVYCTKAQKLEIELEFEFYERLFEEQQELFLSAFIQKQRIFPPDAPVSDAEPTERDIKVAFMAEAIERKTRAAMIESSEG